jgi:hypothetical protein
VIAVAQLYRDRAEAENLFDELKNRWGWAGFTTQDHQRCQVLARIVALIYTWWSLFTRLAIPNPHTEAMTSRPVLLHGLRRSREVTRGCSPEVTNQTGMEAERLPKGNGPADGQGRPGDRVN